MSVNTRFCSGKNIPFFIIKNNLFNFVSVLIKIK